MIFCYRGSPHELLKSINPGEAALLDAASRCHVRFRLGGTKFPPLIYYKIFSHGGLVDINAFAPRDYMHMKKETGKQAINVHYDKPENDSHNGWYMRFENNGWRPINDKVLAQVDQADLQSGSKPKPYHYSKLVRAQETQAQKRAKKIKWLRKLYRDAKNAEIVAEQGEGLNPAAVESAQFQKQLESLYQNPFDDKKFQEVDDATFEQDVDGLIEWCEDLDYDKYMDNWNCLATSAKNDFIPDDEHLHVVGLGEIAFNPKQSNQ